MAISSLLTSPHSRGLLPADSVRAAQLSLLSHMLLEETLRPGVHQRSTQSLVAFLATSQQVVFCSFAGGNHWEIILVLIKCTVLHHLVMDWFPMIHPLAKQGHYRIYLRGRLSFGAVYVKVKNHFLKSTVNMMDPLAERSKAISRDVCSMELKLTVSGGSILAIWNAHCCSVIANHHSHNSHGVCCFSSPPLVKSFFTIQSGWMQRFPSKANPRPQRWPGQGAVFGSTSLAKHGDLMDIIIKHPETLGHFNGYFDICDKKMIIQLVRFIRLLLRQVRGWLVVVDISWKMKMANGSVGELRLAKWRWGPPLVMLDDPNGTSTENQ